MSKEHTVVNKTTGEAIFLNAISEEIALGTVYILKEEDGEQQHYPNWYRKKMLVIDTGKTDYLLILGNWSIKVERKNEQ